MGHDPSLSFFCGVVCVCLVFTGRDSSFSVSSSSRVFGRKERTTHGMKAWDPADGCGSVDDGRTDGITGHSSVVYYTPRRKMLTAQSIPTRATATFNGYVRSRRALVDRSIDRSIDRSSMDGSGYGFFLWYRS